MTRNTYLSLYCNKSQWRTYSYCVYVGIQNTSGQILVIRAIYLFLVALTPRRTCGSSPTGLHRT